MRSTRRAWPSLHCAWMMGSSCIRSLSWPDHMFTRSLGVVMPVGVFVDINLSKIARDEFLEEV